MNLMLHTTCWCSLVVFSWQACRSSVFRPHQHLFSGQQTGRLTAGSTKPWHRRPVPRQKLGTTQILSVFVAWVSLTAGLTVLPTSSPNCTPVNSRLCWTGSFRWRLLPPDIVHLTAGSTRNVVKQSAMCDDLSACLVYATGQRPPLPGTQSDVSTTPFFDGKVNTFGSRRSTPRSRRLVNCGALLTCYWVVDKYHLLTTSVPNSFIATSMTRSQVSDQRRPTPRHRRSLYAVLTLLSVSSSPWPSTKSLR